MAGGGIGVTENSRPGWIRILVTSAIFVPLFIVSFLVSASAVLAQRDPEKALLAWRWSPTAMANLAARSTASVETADYPRAARLAKEALLQWPASPVAARSLGLAAGLTTHDLRRAARLMAYSQSLSRRDVPTQLWFIEESVQRGDVAAALVHYDRALRTSTEIGGQLLPVLVAASDDPAIAGQLAQFLSKAPSWRNDFIAMAVTRAGNPVSLSTLLAASRLNVRDASDRGMLEQGLARMLDLKAPLVAYELARRYDPGTARGAREGGDFGDFAALRPFGWSLNDDSALSASREQGGDGRWRLLARVGPGGNGLLARRMSLLPTGRYRLRSHIEALEQPSTGRVTLSLRCLDGPVLLVAQVDRTTVIDRPVSVPSGCPAVWVTIEGEGPIDGDDANFAIDAVRIGHY